MAYVPLKIESDKGQLAEQYHHNVVIGHEATAPKGDYESWIDSKKRTVNFTNFPQMNADEKQMRDVRILDETDAEKALSELAAIKFKWEDHKDERIHYGFDGRDSLRFAGTQDHSLTGGDDYISMSYLEIIPLLVRYVRALKRELNELKKIKPT